MPGLILTRRIAALCGRPTPKYRGRNRRTEIAAETQFERTAASVVTEAPIAVAPRNSPRGRDWPTPFGHVLSAQRPNWDEPAGRVLRLADRGMLTAGAGFASGRRRLTTLSGH